MWWLYQPYKYLVYTPILVLSTLICASGTLLLAPLLRPRLVSLLCGVTWARINAVATPMRVSVSGREHVDPSQSYVVVCNHQSYYDVLLLYGWLGVDFKWVMKTELRRVPALGVACESLGHVFIDRSNHSAAMASIKAAGSSIVDGTSVVFFPEGTRSRSGDLGRFKKGAFHFANQVGLPILPLTILGTRRILPPRSTDLRPGRARLIIHPPITIGDDDQPTSAEFMNRVRDVIAGPLGPGAI